ncbi:MAG TPA: 2'-5' RNA ligase family protein [Bryobacteraceae bacterium]|nr:2'-5' RNA ligase family protein [Bryobacteraceae bacterium]
MIVPENFSPGHWGWFTLVCYVPDPPSSQLELLRQAIPGQPKPPLHITILPPRPLVLSIAEACDHVAPVVDGVLPFEVDLSDISHFFGTNFLYVDLGNGKELICDIHTQLNTGDLSHSELFEFRPHVTLGGPIPEAARLREKLQIEWIRAHCTRRLHIEELVCLWLPPNRNEHWEWDRYRSYGLRHRPPGDGGNESANFLVAG